MIKFLFFVMCFVLSLFYVLPSPALTLEKFNQRPKLVVVLVIDQFRADYLTRFQKEFKPATSKGEMGGFNHLMSQGAYFPLAEYDVLQSMTCPGHAMIATGSHPYLMGIAINDWYDAAQKKKIYCVDDSEFGVSPKNLKSSTFSDELKGVSEKSKVFTMALKDRSAIMLGGHRADLALWMDIKEFHWTTSGYYGKELPTWVRSENEALKKAGILKKDKSSESKAALSKAYGVQATMALAEAALKNEKLGKGEATDILALSLSSHDMLGHIYGANSPEIHELTLAEDAEIAKLLNAIKKHMGSMKDVVVVLTADHGVAPSVEYLEKAKIEAGRLDYLSLYKKAYERLDQKFGKPAKEWFIAEMSFHFYINPEALKERKVTSEQVQAEVKEVFKTVPGVFDVATASDIQKGILPPGEIGKQLSRQYIPGKSGDVVLIPRAFYINKTEDNSNHLTGYTYDRTVPLVIAGARIKPGVYSSPAKVIDLAPTLSFIMGALPPATSNGRVLSEIFE